MGCKDKTSHHSFYASLQEGVKPKYDLKVKKKPTKQISPKIDYAKLAESIQKINRQTMKQTMK